jgi:hypothetical protein
MVGAPLKTPNPPTPPGQKPRSTAQREPGTAPKRPGMPAPVVRVLLTLFIIWHFTGVFLAALSIPVSSDLVLNMAQKGPMMWYLDALFMNQGHSFFAPDVGPGHLIRYQLYGHNNQEIERGEFPSRKQHWPRLLYHRYFMLADQSELPFEDKPTRDLWQRKYLDAFGRQLLNENPHAQAVRLQRYAHWPPPRSYFLDREGKPLKPRPPLTDPKGYELLTETTVRRSDLAPPPMNQGTYYQNFQWQQGRPETARRWTGAPR